MIETIVEDGAIFEDVEILRPSYQAALERLRDKKIIKVLTGVRRCGKSTVMQMFAGWLREQGVEDERIIELNLEDISNESLLDYHRLHDYVTDRLIEGAKTYVFLDEIQMVEGFERAIDSLFLRDNVDLYLTGSNARMLSGELATLLSGRYVEIPIYPLSFAEYWGHLDRFVGDGLPVATRDEAFQRFFDWGGFPYTLSVGADSVNDYLDGIVNTVLVKDVLTRKKMSDATLVRRLAQFLVDSSGSLVSVKRIADTLTSGGKKTNSDTVASYLEGLTEAFLFYRCPRFDVGGKKYLSFPEKFYPVDAGLRRALLGSKRVDYGHRLEGVVYVELRRRGYEVWVGQIDGAEVDFVARRDGAVEYFQVSATVAEAEVLEREVAPLRAIDDNFPKTILTLDPGASVDGGIQIRNLVDWLLE